MVGIEPMTLTHNSLFIPLDHLVKKKCQISLLLFKNKTIISTFFNIFLFALTRNDKYNFLSFWQGKRCTEQSELLNTNWSVILIFQTVIYWDTNLHLSRLFLCFHLILFLSLLLRAIKYANEAVYGCQTNTLFTA